MAGAAAGGDTIIDGKYRVVRTLGSGGMGDVFVVEHVFLRKMLALKLLRRELTEHPEAIARFEQEARATSLLEHPNIVRVSDFGRTPAGELYLVMELLTGQALADLLAKTPQLPAERACDIVCQVLAGLEAAHMHRIIHRDLKPENVFLLPVSASGKGTPSGLSSPSLPVMSVREHVKILDFGIAKLQGEQDLRLTSMGNIVGTPQYMAPEQARGEAELDHRIDIHAVGVILYELLSGRAPYDGENYHQVIARILTAAPPNLLSLVPDIDPSLASIVHMALAKQPSERFPSAADFREAIEKVVTAWHRAAGWQTETPVVDVPLRVDLLGGGTEPSAVLSALRPEAHSANTPAPPVRPSTGTSHDPFAPPGEETETPLELATFTPPPSAPPPVAPTHGASTPVDDVPVHVFLAQKRREAQGPGRLVRTVILGTLGFSLIMGLIYLARSFSSEDPGLTLRAASKATVRIDNLPEDSLVLLDGVRTFLNPIEMSLSSATHEIRIEAEGFRPRTFLFVPDKGEIVFDADMEKIARGGGGKKDTRKDPAPAKDAPQAASKAGAKTPAGKGTNPTLSSP